MTKEQLDALLASGAITQEAYDELIKTVVDPEPTPDPEPAPDPEPDDNEAVKRRYQAQLDREMAKERKEKAELKRKLERLENKMLTEEEKKQREFEEQQREIEEQRKELMFEKNKMYAVKSMKKANINDSEEAMLIMEKLVSACEDESEIDEIVSLLKSWRDKDVAKGVETEVDKRFKNNGYTPKKSDNLNNGVNPYTKEHWNLTDQMSLEISNPELAKQLQAAAGVK